MPATPFDTTAKSIIASLPLPENVARGYRGHRADDRETLLEEDLLTMHHALYGPCPRRTTDEEVSEWWQIMRDGHSHTEARRRTASKYGG